MKKNEDFKYAVLTEAAKYPKDQLSDLYNASIQIKEAGVKYDYLACGHSEYEMICSQIESLTERKKSFEKYLQTIKEETTYIDPISGEMINLQPAPKTSSTTVAITINK